MLICDAYQICCDIYTMFSVQYTSFKQQFNTWLLVLIFGWVLFSPVFVQGEADSHSFFGESQFKAKHQSQIFTSEIQSNISIQHTSHSFPISSLFLSIQFLVSWSKTSAKIEQNHRWKIDFCAQQTLAQLLFPNHYFW